MASPRTHPEPEHGPHADDILLAAAVRGLGSRQRLRLVAVAVWCSFLGAILVLAEILSLLPHGETFGLGRASIVFLCSWAATLIPVSLALALCGPHER